MPRMAPVVSALARQTMTAAFEDLERTLSPADAREMRSITTLQQVRAAALDIEKQLAARQALRNMRRLMPMLNGLEHYAKVADVLCNGTPFLSWIWSPITLILRVASEYVEAFEQLMKGYARIAAALSRFELLSNTFTDADFQHSLAVFYANILQFHKHAYNFVRRSGWRLLFLTSWGRFQRRFDHILEDLDRHGDLIDRAANARNISEARQLRQDIRTWKEESLEQVRQAEEHQATKQYRTILSWLRIDETEQLSMFELISEEGSKFPGTCAWMLKNERICSWLQRKPGGNLLWLQGNPGSGKSVLSTQLVNFLRCATSFVMNHSCSQAFASSTKYEVFLKSLLHQLLHKSGELVAYTYQEFVVGKRLPTMSNLEQFLETLLGALSEAGHTEYVWIIVDGVEECEVARQARLITFLSQISKPGMHGNTVCKVLITSRAHPIRLKRIWQKQLVSLSDETEQLTEAIKLYASQRLRLLHERFQQLDLDGDDVESIEQMIAQKAAGMFLYARLVLDYLGTNIFYSGDELKRSIDQLPETITEFYRNILAQMLSRFDSRSANRIRCALGWIAYAKRPLKRLELLSALAFSSGDPGVTSPAPRYMLELCSPLVEERRDTTLSFIHVSVKEFLQSSSSAVAINEHDALREHGLATVTCLLAAIQVFDNGYQEQTRLLRLVKGVHALHVYSTEYWTEYLLENAATAHGLEVSPILITLASRLAKALGMISSAPLARLATSSNVVDDRLSLLDRYPEIKTQIEKALLARSAKRLEYEILGQPCATNTYLVDGISQILDAYQKAVEIILDQDFCPGASTEELELFKSHFRASAYTCRLRSCPRATVGFASGQLRREHEIGHAGGFRCSFPGCHYPPFRTAQSLELHGQKYHTTSSSRRSIRRVGQLPSAQPPSNSTTNRTMANNTQALSERGNSHDRALESNPGPRKVQISGLLGDIESAENPIKPLSGSPRASPNLDPMTLVLTPPTLKASVRAKTPLHLSEPIESSMTASDKTELEVHPSTGHIQSAWEPSSLIDPFTREDFNDPKVIAATWSLPLPIGQSFPRLSELYEFVGVSSSISDLVLRLHGIVQIDDVKLLVHMLDLVSQYDEKQERIIQREGGPEWEMIYWRAVTPEYSYYEVYLEQAILNGFRKYSLNRSDFPPFPSALQPSCEEIRAFDIPDEDSSVNKDGMATRNSHHSPVKRFLGRKSPGISSKKAKRTFGQVSDSTANAKGAKRPHKEGEEPFHTTNRNAADYVVGS